MIGKIRLKIGYNLLKRDVSSIHLERRMANFSEAKKIGIMYSLPDAETYTVISEFVTQLQQNHKEVKALGYLKNKQLAERFLPKLAFDFFSTKDVGLFYIPRNVKVNDFIETNFDLLIDLSQTDELPLKYISGLSHAYCRVGRFSEKYKSCYDLMFQISPETTLEEYMQQIIHYLTLINGNERISSEI